jgi:hypothetical protein
MSTHLKLYALTSHHTGIIFIATSKKQLYNFIDQREKKRVPSTKDYWTFSQILRGQNVTRLDLQSGVFYVIHAITNKPIKDERTLFE